MASMSSSSLKVGDLITGRFIRYLIGAIMALYVPVFALLFYMGTPRYLIAPYIYYWLAPSSLGVFAFMLIASQRHVRVAAWSVVVILGAWILENYIVSVYYLSKVKLFHGEATSEAVLASVVEVNASVGYWSFVYVPLLIALVFATLFHVKIEHAI